MRGGTVNKRSKGSKVDVRGFADIPASYNQELYEYMSNNLIQ